MDDDKLKKVLEEIKKRNLENPPTDEKVRKRLEKQPNESVKQQADFWTARSRSRSRAKKKK